MTIDEIRKLSLQYASGTPPKQKKPPKCMKDKRRQRIDISALATKLTEPLHYNSRKMHLDRLHLSTYKEYIQSSHWKDFRLSYLYSLDSTECVIALCKQTGVVLHHASYVNLGSETFEDVFLVCLSCHDKIHKEIKRVIASRRRSNEILGRLPRLSCVPPSAEEMNPCDYSLPWGGLFSRHSVAENTESAEL